MSQTIVRLQSSLLRDYYKYFSKYAKGKTPENKVAWVTSFAPVEILEAMGISYYYPESYAAVIAASEKEQSSFQESEKQGLSLDCCSYSCCFNGSLETDNAPRGIPPKPDILIATNNQCNTLPCWWNVLAARYNVPLIVIDYPGESVAREKALTFVNEQHLELIKKLEQLTGTTLDYARLEERINNSSESVKAWNSIISYLPHKSIDISTLFDDINFLITSRCKKETSELYMMMAEDVDKAEESNDELIPIFWLGYPLWYHPNRLLKEYLEGIRIVGSNYLTWWNLNYQGENSMEKLFSAYNFTFLNLLQDTRDERLKRLFDTSGARGAIVIKNKSCKCDFVSARNISVPQAEIDADMIDRFFLDKDIAKSRIDLLRETVCTV